MSEYDESSLDLLAAYEARFDPSADSQKAPTTTGVLDSASFIASSAIDVHISMVGVKSAAHQLQSLMKQKSYSPATWQTHELHPKQSEMSDEAIANFIFTMDLLNFCFWSDEAVPEEERFAIEYRGRRFTGYWSLVAALRKALEEGVEVTSPEWWVSEDCTQEKIDHIFRSAGTEAMPLLKERWECLREAGQVLKNHFDSSIVVLLSAANDSAIIFINLLTSHFSCFNDVHAFEDTTVCIHKRAQILVADLWACFEGEGYGRFDDVSEVTMFADYRIPQMLHTLNCLVYSPPLDAHIRAKKMLPSGSPWEIELRGTSIWTVELLRQEMEKLSSLEELPSLEAQSHEAVEVTKKQKTPLNAILIDFFLYDMVKELEAQQSTQHSDEDDSEDSATQMIPHHRTRSIWY